MRIVRIFINCVILLLAPIWILPLAFGGFLVDLTKKEDTGILKIVCGEVWFWQ